MTANPAILRDILRQLSLDIPGYPDFIIDSAILSPPTVAGYREDEVRAQLDLLYKKGWIYSSREIRMNPPPDPVCFRPTREGMKWVRRARYDDLWEAARDELQEALGS